MLHGIRVRLRPLEPDDAATVWRWHQNHEFTVLDGHIYPPTLAATTEWVCSLPLLTYANVRFGIEDERGRLVGYTSLRRTEPEDRCADFGIALGPEHWNQGYGTDATRTILRFAFREMNLHRVTLRVADYNPRALRVYEKCGFRLEGRIRETRFHDGEWRDKLLMGILDREFRDLQQSDRGANDERVSGQAPAGQPPARLPA